MQENQQQSANAINSKNSNFVSVSASVLYVRIAQPIKSYIKKLNFYFHFLVGVASQKSWFDCIDSIKRNHIDWSMLSIQLVLNDRNNLWSIPETFLAFNNLCAKKNRFYSNLIDHFLSSCLLYLFSNGNWLCWIN